MTLSNPFTISSLSVALLLISMVTPVWSAKKKEKSNGAFPSLDILPEGSILTDVTFPRYNKDFIPISLLTADTLTVLEKSVIKATNVYVEYYNNDGSTQFKTNMSEAFYNQKKSTLRSQKKTTISGNGFSAKGTQLTLHQQSKRAFLKGPAITIFTSQQEQASTKTEMNKNSPPLIQKTQKTLTGALITGSTAILMAEPPNRLTESQLTELDRLAEPITQKVQEEQNKSLATIQNTKKEQADVNQEVKSFLTDINQKDLYTESPAPEQKLEPVITDTPDSSETEKTTPEVAKTKPQESIHISCENGLYSDYKEGVFVYLKNVRLTTPEYNLKCSDQLKIFIDPAQLSTDKKDSTKKGEEKSSYKDSIKTIVASGNVVITGKDEKGNKYIAKAATATYDVKSETTILRGGYPSIQQSANNFLKAQDANAYIKIPKSGSIITSSNKWETRFDVPKQN